MMIKKPFKIYYLVICEGRSESLLFANLRKYFADFKKSNLGFSDKVEIKESNISSGVLNGVSCAKGFKKQHEEINKKYKQQKKLYILDKDLKDSKEIAKLVNTKYELIQFVPYNTEYFLLDLAGKTLPKPSTFEDDLPRFRTYCKTEFLKIFGKEVVDFKKDDFEKIFANKDEEIKKKLNVIFKLMEN